MAEPTNINELFSQGEKEALEASKTSKGPYETLISMKDRGYLPEMAGGTTAAVAGGFAIKNYLKNLSAVKDAIAAEEEAVRRLRTPATKKGAQPFAKEGFRLSGAKDVKAIMPEKGTGGVPYTRLSNVRPIGGPEGTGLGVLKGKEGLAAARMTAEDMIKYLRQPSNYGVTATTPRIEIKGFQTGEPLRKTVVVTPSDVKAGKLPTTAVPAGALPKPEASNIFSRLVGRVESAMRGTPKALGVGFNYIPLAIEEYNRGKSDYENPLTREVYRRDEVTDIGGINYATADMATIARFHPDNAENNPDITDEMRASFFQRK
jgi:hypothetical protein